MTEKTVSKSVFNKLAIFVVFCLSVFYANCSQKKYETGNVGNTTPPVPVSSNTPETPLATDPLAMNVQLPTINLTYPHAAISSTRTIQIEEFLGLNVVPPLVTMAQWESQAQKISELGLKWVRFGLYWNLIENDLGVRDYTQLDQVMNISKKYHLNVIIYVIAPPKSKSANPTSDRYDQYPPAPAQYQYYANFLKEILIRYKDPSNNWGISAIQIWNEPNLRMFWQTSNGFDDPTAVHDLTSTVSTTLKSYDSNITLVLAGLAYWGVMLNSSGQPKNMFVDYFYPIGTFNSVNAIAAHPYLNNPFGDIDSSNPYNFITNGSFFINNAGKSMWATEWGWGSYKSQTPSSNELVKEDVQSIYIIQRLILMMSMGFEKSFLFTIQDLSASLVGDPYRTMGLLDESLNQKNSYQALARVVSWLKGEVLAPESLANFSPTLVAQSYPELWFYSWKSSSSNKHFIFCWSDSVKQISLPVNSSIEILNPFDGSQSTLMPTEGMHNIKIPVYPILIRY